MRALGVSCNFVMAWTKSPDQDLTMDGRGWRRGTPRLHPIDIRERLCAIRDELVASPDEYYVGDLAVQQRYRDHYPDDPVPGIDYVARILREEHRTSPHRPKRRGVARYLGYPVASVARLGPRIAEADFVGRKYLAGVSDPLHFLSVAYQEPPRLRCIQRTKGETAGEAITITQQIFNDLGWPDVVRVDAGNPFTGRGERMDGRGTRSIPRYAAFLLERAVIPVFGAIRSPWNQAHVEGSNSVFGRNFWNQRTFGSVADVDRSLDAFNTCSKRYAQWVPWTRAVDRDSFVPRICFIRKAEEDTRGKEGWIPVASEVVTLPKAYIGLFVFAEWNLKEQTLRVHFEYERKIQQIKDLPFPIHPSSLKKCTHFIV